MSGVVYREPYKLPAGILALLVHCVFFALLYFGFSWQTHAPAAMSVELWQSLPEEAPAPPVKVKQPPPPPPPPAVEEVVKPDIVIPDKKPVKEVKPVEKPLEKPKIKPVEKPIEKPVEKPKVKPEVAKKSEVKPVKPAQPSAEQQRVLAEQQAKEAAIGKVVDEYTSKISNKIRRNIVMPPDVANDARAEFLVTLLPGGSVLNAVLVKSSGNAAYDSAVERAIRKSDPLPLPADAGLFSRFRELRLSFKPVE